VSSSKSADLARGESNWFTRAVEDASSWSQIGVSACHNSGSGSDFQGVQGSTTISGKCSPKLRRFAVYEAASPQSTDGQLLTFSQTMHRKRVATVIDKPVPLHVRTSKK
jgi:hypothetical protein